MLAKARDAVRADGARIGAIFDRHDVLISPVMGSAAIPVRRWESRGALWTLMGMSRFYPFTGMWNHLGNPAASVPAGIGGDGLPRAVMLVGRPGGEATLLRLAAQLEAERPWADARPPLS
jgi:amidase